MIVTCPNCNVLFNLDDELLGDKGRKVKCTSCKEIWFQRPENYQELDQDLEEELLAVDESENKNEEDEKDVEEYKEEKYEQDIERASATVSSEKKKSNIVNNHIEKNSFLSIAISLLVFFMILVYFLINREGFVQKNPKMHGFYSLFAIKPDISAKNLVFDRIEAVNNGKYIKITGNIINLSQETAKVPYIEISLMDVSDNIISKWYAMPPKDILEKEGHISFKYNINDINLNLKEQWRLNIQVRFVIGVNDEINYEINDEKSNIKTDEASDENILTPHQDDLNHRSAHVESLKSHQDASSVSGQESSHH